MFTQRLILLEDREHTKPNLSVFALSRFCCVLAPTVTIVVAVPHAKRPTTPTTRDIDRPRAGARRARPGAGEGRYPKIPRYRTPVSKPEHFERGVFPQ